MNGSMRWLVINLCALLIACGDAERAAEGIPEEDSARERTVPRAQLPADSVRIGVPAPRDTTRPPGSVGAISESEIVVAMLSGRSIQLSRDTVPAGEVTVVVENKAEAHCNFEVSGQFSGRWRAPVAAGRVVQISMVLSRAPYQLYCASGGATAPPSPDTLRLVVR
jgi:hypothetical protein